MTTVLPVDRLRELPIDRNSKLAASPAFDERVTLAEFVPANGTFRAVLQGNKFTRVIVLTKNQVSNEWSLQTEIKFVTPSTTQSLEGEMMSVSQSMFHLVPEPETLPLLPAPTLEYRAGMLLLGGQPMPGRVKCHSAALVNRV